MLFRSAPTGLGPSLTAIGQYFNRIQAPPVSPALGSTVVKLVYDPTLDAYKASLTQFSPQLYGEEQAEMALSTQRFQQLMTDGGSIIGLGGDHGMLWLNYSNEDSIHGAYDGYQKIWLRANRGALGFQKAFENAWTLGFAAEYEDDSVIGYQNLWKGSGHTEHFGSVLKRQLGSTVLSGTVTFGTSDISSQRTGDFTVPFTTNIKRNIYTLAGSVRAFHSFDYGSLYATPMIDFGVTGLFNGYAAEATGEPTGLILYANNEGHVFTRPAAKFGNVFSFGSGVKLNIYEDLGYTRYLNGRNTFVNAAFTGAVSAAGSMNVPVWLGSLFETTSGLELTVHSNISIGAEYSKTVDTHYSMNRLAFHLNIPF